MICKRQLLKHAGLLTFTWMLLRYNLRVKMSEILSRYLLQATPSCCLPLTFDALLSAAIGRCECYDKNARDY